MAVSLSSDEERIDACIEPTILFGCCHLTADAAGLSQQVLLGLAK